MKRLLTERRTFVHARLLSTYVVTGLVLGASLVLSASADTTSTSSSSSSGSLTSELPSTFSGMQGISSMTLPTFQSCAAGSVSSGLQGIGDILTGKKTTNSSNSANCGSDQVTGQDPQCQSSGGKYDASIWKKRDDQLKQIEANISCKQNNIAKIQGELSCFSNQANMLDQQVNSLRGIFQQNIQRFNQDVNTYQNLISDRQNQVAQVAEKLGCQSSSDGSSGGGCSSSSGGLLGIQSTLTDAVNTGLPQESTSVQAQQTKIQQDTAGYYQAIKNEEIQDSQQCFTKTATFQCKNSDGSVKPCSAQDFLLERFSENQGINAGGQINTNNSYIASQQQNETASLQSVLSGIFGSFASNPQISSDQTQAAQNATASLTSSATIFTPQQILSSPYWSQLQQFDHICNNSAACLPVSTFFYNTMVNCYNQSVNTVNTDIQTPGRALYQSWNSINQETTAMKNQVTADLQKYSQIYTAAMAALTGSHYPLNLASCNSASASNSIKCLTDLQTNLSGLLNGSTSASQINMTISAKSSANTIQLSCYGVNGCVTSLKTLGTNLQKEVTTQKSNMNDYINQANNSIQTATTGFSSQAQALLQSMKQQLNQVNATLAQNGMSPIKLPDVQRQPLQKSCQQSSDGSSNGQANCIYDMPQDMFALFGLPDVTSSSFSNGSQEVGQLASREQDALSKVTQAENQLTSEEAKCKGELAQKSLQTVADAQDGMSGCDAYNWCQGKLISGSNTLGSLTQDAATLFQDAGLSLDVNANLDGCNTKFQAVQAPTGGDPQAVYAVGQMSSQNAKCATSATKLKTADRAAKLLLQSEGYTGAGAIPNGDSGDE